SVLGRAACGLVLDRRRDYLRDGRAPGGHEGLAPLTLKLSKATASSSLPKRFSPSETACSLMTAGPSAREEVRSTQPAPCQKYVVSLLLTRAMRREPPPAENGVESVLGPTQEVYWSPHCEL